MSTVKFVQAGTSNYSDPFNVSWSNNPIYQSPESSGTSWFDQVEHWNAPSEGIEAFTPSMDANPTPFWANRNTFEGYSWNSGVEGLWRNIEAKSSANASALTQEAPISSEINSSNVSAMPAELSEGIEVSEETVESSEAAIEATETAGEVLEGSTGIGLAAILNQQLGQATTSALQAGVNSQINSDFVKNSLQQGIGAVEQANIIKGEEEINSNKISSISQIGSIIGPLGSLLGQAIGQSIYQPGNSYNLNTANSFNGMINPQDTGVVQSLNTDAATGDTQQVENV